MNNEIIEIDKIPDWLFFAENDLLAIEFFGFIFKSQS